MARLIAAVKNMFGGTNQVDWRDELIGYDVGDQTMEEALAVLESFGG